MAWWLISRVSKRVLQFNIGETDGIAISDEALDATDDMVKLLDAIYYAQFKRRMTIEELIETLRIALKEIAEIRIKDGVNPQASVLETLRLKPFPKTKKEVRWILNVGNSS